MSSIARRKVRDLLAAEAGQEVLAKGWVRTKRGNKQIKFIKFLSCTSLVCA